MNIKKSKLLFLLISIILVLSSSNAFSQEAIATEAPKLTWTQQVEKWYDNHMGYGSVFGLMVVESSFIPLPSEIVIPPAAYVASKPESNLNIFLIVLFGTLGAIVGALINYFLAMWLGRPIVYKFADSKIGRLFLLSSEKIEQAEAYFNKHGKVSTLVGRLIPAVRQLISIPAGLARMNLLSFIGFTALGAGIWSAILALLGYFLHGQSDLINKYSKEIGYIIAVAVFLIIAYLIIKYILNKRKAK